MNNGEPGGPSLPPIPPAPPAPPAPDAQRALPLPPPVPTPYPQQGYPQQGYAPPAGTGPMQQLAPGAPSPATAANPSKTAGIILAVCAALMALTLFTKGWASATEGKDSVSAGLLGFSGCRGDRCESVVWERGAKRLDVRKDVDVFRILGLLGGLAAVGMMGFASVQALSGKPRKIPLRATEGVMGVAAFALTSFVIRMMMSNHDVHFFPSWGAVLGIGALLVGAAVLRKQLKPLAAASPA